MIGNGEAAYPIGNFSRALLFALAPLVPLWCGCAGLLGGTATVTETRVGRVEMDLPSRRRLEITKHDAAVEGDTVSSITVEWRNVSNSSFKARIHTTFYAASGKILEDDGDEWVSYTIPPGRTQVLQWSPPAGEAASYVIRVESAGWWPL